MTTIKYNLKNYYPLLLLLLLSACSKNDYLDIDASNRPPLSAKVKFINARSSDIPVQFWDFTRQVTKTALNRNTATADYLDTQYGKVQYNLTEGTGTSYKASYVFGGSSNFIQETNTTSYSGPNGPIATFYHSLFTVAKLKPSTLNPGNTDSLILVYDDLTAPAAGKVKLRFANFSPDQRALTLAYAGGAAIYGGVAYGNFGDQVIIPYTNGKSPSTIDGLSWKTLGPFKEVNAGTNLQLTVTNGQGQELSIPELSNVTLEAGKLYTIFVNGFQNGTPGLHATVITHN